MSQRTGARRRGRSRTSIAGPPVALVVALCGWMAAAAFVAPHGEPRGTLAIGLPARLLQATCGEGAAGGDDAVNWGAVAPDGSVPACESAAPPLLAAEQGGNWGSVPPEQVVVSIPLDGAKIAKLPEVVAQHQGEMGGQSCEGTDGGNEAPAQPAAELDPRWNNVNRWEAAIGAATQVVYQETGVLVPANVVKAIIMIETGGDPNASAGSAYGLMQVTAGSFGSYDLARVRTDPAYGIYAGTKDLALRYLDSGKMPWENVAVGYFSGHYEPDGSSDQFSTDFQYMDKFRTLFAELEAAAPGNRTCEAVASGGGGGTDGGVGVASIWGNLKFGGADPILSQDFGPTDFSRYVRPEWYSYALDYGFSEPGHTGLDVAIPAGTPLYAPMDGSIICAGTNNGTGEDSCAAFLSVYGGATSGRLQMKLPNGDMLILGHVNESIVKPGDQVKPGQQIGISGSYNGDHVHVEYRTRDAGTPSGWRIIDPRGPLDGVAITVTPGTSKPPDTGMPGTPVAQATPVPDRDQDGLGDDEETTLGTNPDDPDTDDDSLLDGAEKTMYGSDPLLNDSDDDGVLDGDEVNLYKSNPISTDTDGDGLPDFDEVNLEKTDPTTPDTDDDGVSDLQERDAATNPNDKRSFPATVDPDGDGLSDAQEAAAGTDPANADSDFDGLFDGDEVHARGSNPLDDDTDDDGLPDYNEATQHNTNPADADSDDDGVNDHDEVQAGTDPNAPEAPGDAGSPEAEADGDGREDGVEINFGSPEAADDGQGEDDGDDGDDGVEIDLGSPESQEDDGDGVEIDLGTPETGDDGDGEGDGDDQQTADDGGEGEERQTDDGGDEGDGDDGADGDGGEKRQTDDDGDDGDDRQTGDDGDDEQPEETGSPEASPEASPIAADPNDPDADGLTNEGETASGTDPANPDSDADGLNDGDEVNNRGSNPLNNDTDGDLLWDGDEALTFGTDLFNPDPDADGLTDYDEVLTYGTGPFNPDSDADGLLDGDEVFIYLTNPLVWDTDGDGYDDLSEINAGANPNDAGSFP